MAEQNVNLAELSDDEIANLDPASLAGSIQASEPGTQAEAQPSGTDSSSEVAADETGGAAPVDDTDDDEDVGEGSTSEESEEDDGNDEPSSEEAGARAAPHQGAATGPRRRPCSQG